MVICYSSGKKLIQILVPGGEVLLQQTFKNVEITLELGNGQRLEEF